LLRYFRRKPWLATLWLTVALLVATTAGIAVQTVLRADAQLAIGLRERLVLGRLVNVLLHDTPQAQYDRAVESADGRGVVAGRADFSTAGGEAWTIVDSYADFVPDSPLVAAYLPVLATLAKERSVDVTQLAGYPEAWARAAIDPLFRSLQDDYMQRMYFNPALDLCHELGVTHPLGFAILYDTLIQHGAGSDPDSVGAVVNRTVAAQSGRPRDGVAEREWLAAFLDLRAQTLARPADSRRAVTWPYTIGRVEALRALLRDGNVDLRTPLTVKPYGTAHTIEADPADVPPGALPTWGPITSPSPSPSGQPPRTPPAPASPPRATANPSPARSDERELADPTDVRDMASLSFAGSAARAGSGFRLTTGPQQAGAVWLGKAVDTGASFESMFRVSISQLSDGMAFVIRGAGSREVGGVGGGLGYGHKDNPGYRIEPSVAVEFDLIAAEYDPAGGKQSVAITRDGDVTTHLSSTSPPVNLVGGPVTVWVEYTAATHRLAVFVSGKTTRPDKPTLTASVDLGRVTGTRAIVGITAGTGGDWANQDVLEWRLSV